MVDRYEALERYSRLRDDGVISEEEFAAEKAKLLGSGIAPTSPAPAPAAKRYTPKSIFTEPAVEQPVWPIFALVGTLVAAGLGFTAYNHQASSVATAAGDAGGNATTADNTAAPSPMPVTQPVAAPKVSQEVEESWADPCSGHYLGKSEQAFSLDVTNRPLDARIEWSDFGSVIGRPVHAVAPGKLQITDYQSKEVWTATCIGDVVSLQPPAGSQNQPLVAHRSTEQLQMSGD